jgi:hypothetical protein
MIFNAMRQAAQRKICPPMTRNKRQRKKLRQTIKQGWRSAISNFRFEIANLAFLSADYFSFASLAG